MHNNPLIYIDPYGLFQEESKDFMHGVSRGAADDTSWGASTLALGEFEPKGISGKLGYYAGTTASFAAGFYYGSSEAKLANYGLKIFRKMMQKGPTQSLKGISVAKTVTKLEKAHSSIEVTKISALSNKQISKPANTSPQKINKLVESIEHFLEGKGKVIINSDGDMILMRQQKKIRFDVKDPHGDRPHFHIEQQTSTGKWTDATSQHRYYFKEE